MEADIKTQPRGGIPWPPLRDRSCAVAQNPGHAGGAHPTTSSNFLIFFAGAGGSAGILDTEAVGAAVFGALPAGLLAAGDSDRAK